MENTWNLEKTKRLFYLAGKSAECGQSLAVAFEQMAAEMGQSVGSVRNYYYSQAKLFKMMPDLSLAMGIESVKARAKPFTAFTREQCLDILRKALTGKASGKSVRTTLWEMAMGDKTLALRLQNKYRSLLLHHKDMVEQVASELTDGGVSFYHPYSKSVITPESARGFGQVLDKISCLSAIEKQALLKKLLG